MVGVGVGLCGANARLWRGMFVAFVGVGRWVGGVGRLAAGGLARALPCYLEPLLRWRGDQLQIANRCIAAPLAPPRPLEIQSTHASPTSPPLLDR